MKIDTRDIAWQNNCLIYKGINLELSIELLDEYTHTEGGDPYELIYKTYEDKLRLMRETKLRNILNDTVKKDK